MNPPARRKEGQARTTIVLNSEHETEDGERKTRTHAPIGQEDNSGQGELLFSGRVVLSRREGKNVYLRSLRPGEEDTGEGVRIEAGERVLIDAGDLSFNSRQIDASLSSPGTGGYAPVANTIWTWYQVAPRPGEFFLLFFALARRTDAAHALWSAAIEARDEAREKKGTPRRTAAFELLATAEMMVIALHRCFEMMEGLRASFCPALPIPASVQTIRRAVKEIRHAFEHIDDRARGRIDPHGTVDPDALTIFNQPGFVHSSLLRYRGHALNLETEVIAALLDAREFIMKAIDEGPVQNNEGPNRNSAT